MASCLSLFLPFIFNVYFSFRLSSSHGRAKNAVIWKILMNEWQTDCQTRPSPVKEIHLFSLSPKLHVYRTHTHISTIFHLPFPAFPYRQCCSCQKHFICSLVKGIAPFLQLPLFPASLWFKLFSHFKFIFPIKTSDMTAAIYILK